MRAISDIAFRTGVALAALAALVGPAWGAKNCPVLLDEQVFEKRGGRLEQTREIDLTNLPDLFFCDRIPCSGTVVFSGFVDGQGAVHVLGVEGNSWDARPKWHADVIGARLQQKRYAPPRLAGRSVCVKMFWRIVISRPQG